MVERGAERSRSRRRSRWQAAGFAIAAAGIAAAIGGAVAASRPVTPPAGPSLLTQLRTGVDVSALGRAGYTGAPPTPSTRPEPLAPAGSWLVDGFELSGQDLYRINCRSCHGVGAQGLRPVIPAILGVARQTSAAGVQEEREKAGQQVGGSEARRQAAEAELAIRHRLLEGGRVMPALAHLTDAEVDVLLGYLGSIAGTPDPARPATVRVPAVTVGEHVAKAVCQICHDATPGQLRAPADLGLSALAEFPDKYSAREFVRRVASASSQPGAAPGHKPRLDYLRPEELEAAYVYLTAFTPAAR